MIVVFLGSPGVGKGTQAGLISRSLGWRHISTGELLRQAVEDETPLGTQARDFMDRGLLVPDDLMLNLVVETVGNEAHGVILDGFPRTLVQAEGLDDLLRGGRGQGVDRVILLSADEDEVVRRMLARGRADDTPETVRRRLVVYHESTTPLVEYYRERGLLREVNGVGDIQVIHQRVTAALS